MKEFAHAISCVYIKLWMHLGRLENTDKARVAPTEFIISCSAHGNFKQLVYK